MTTSFQSVVVPAVPPKPPQVTLVGSAVSPPSGSDPASPYELTSEQLAALPDDLRQELAERQGDSWVRGFTYQPESHAAAFVTGACTTEGEHGPELQVGSNLDPVVFVPYVVVAADRCSTFGFEEHDFKGRATRLLDNATPSAVEVEFWTGAVATAEGWPNFILASEAAEDLTPSEVPSAARGLQILQDALATCGFGGQGMIHCEPQAAPNLLSGRRVGPLYYDIFDNLIIPGVGYPGTGPKSETTKEIEEREEARETWMYATDLVKCRQSGAEVFPDTFAEATDWGQGSLPNTITFYAERFAAAYPDGACHFACKVKLPA